MRYRLLTPGSHNAKTAKSMRDGRYLTAILHLAPSDMSGTNVCPMASDGCRAACLTHAGRGAIFTASDRANVDGLSSVNRGRVKRTHRFTNDRAGFLADLGWDLEAHVRAAKRAGMLPAVRLNGTSDVRWEKIPCRCNRSVEASVFDAFPEITFYDYTKIPNRRVSGLDNYHLTFSLSESNDRHALHALDCGINVAVVMRVSVGNHLHPEQYPKEPLPDSWGGYPVIDGDTSDLRFLDRHAGPLSGPVIVGLRAKGKRALADTIGFVREPTGPMACFDPNRTPRVFTDRKKAA